MCFHENRSLMKNSAEEWAGGVQAAGGLRTTHSQVERLVEESVAAEVRRTHTEHNTHVKPEDQGCNTHVKSRCGTMGGTTMRLSDEPQVQHRETRLTPHLPYLKIKNDHSMKIQK